MSSVDAETYINTAQYLAILATSIIFTIVTIEKKSMVYSVLAGVCWLFMSAVHLAISPITSAIQTAPVALYFGIGLVFVVLSIYYATILIHDAYVGRSSVDTV